MLSLKILFLKGGGKEEICLVINTKKGGVVLRLCNILNSFQPPRLFLPLKLMFEQFY